MTPIQIALLAATGPAGFFAYNKINHGSIWPSNCKDGKDSLNSRQSHCSSRSSKKKAKKELEQNKLERERAAYGDLDLPRQDTADSAPPAYSSK